MGRSRRQENKIHSLREGHDSNGGQVFLGGLDSEGRRVGFIDSDGLAYESLEERDKIRSEAAVENALRQWQERAFQDPMPSPADIIREASIQEVTADFEEAIYETFRDEPLSLSSRNLFWLAEAPHWSDAPEERDCAKTALLYAKEMRRWKLGGRAEGEPNPQEIAKEMCQNDTYLEKAAKAASGMWELAERAELARRGEWRRMDLHEPRHPLQAEGGRTLYPSFVEGGEIVLRRLTETRAEREELQNRLRELNKRLQAEGLESIPEEIFKDLLQEEEEEIESRPLWQAEWRRQSNAEGDALQVETMREGVDEARRAAWKLEEAIINAPLLRDEIVLEKIGVSQPPEEAKMQALEILAEGTDGDYVRRMRALGVSEEQILRRAESVVLGSSADRAFLIAQAELFLPEIGELRVTVSAEDEAGALREIKKLLPGALFLEEDSH